MSSLSGLCEGWYDIVSIASDVEISSSDEYNSSNMKAGKSCRNVKLAITSFVVVDSTASSVTKTRENMIKSNTYVV